MAFQTLKRAICLLAVGCSSGLWTLGAPLGIAAAAQRSAWGGDTAPSGVAVQDVERILAEDQRKSDAKVARQLSGLVLTERMSYARLKALEQIVPGKKSLEALVALADASAFLPPTPVNVLSKAPPDLNQQRRIIALTVDYLGKTLPRLPDFYATRTTIRYDGDARRAGGAGPSPQGEAPWRDVGSSKVVVAYRNGKEVVDPREWGMRPSRSAGHGLVTRGTFGPILLTVIEDAAHGETRWDHWERGGTGTLAVFRYSVPADQSHYAVAYHRAFSPGLAEQGTGYHGVVAIDPASGAILRITVQADLPFGSPILRADVMVQYRPVVIGGKTYTCPVRSVSISLDEGGLSGGMGMIVPYNSLTGLPQIPQSILLNDVTFSDYHLFRSRMRILPGKIPPSGH